MVAAGALRRIPPLRNSPDAASTSKESKRILVGGDACVAIGACWRAFRHNRCGTIEV